MFQRIAVLIVSVLVSLTCLAYLKDRDQRRATDKWIKAQCEMALSVQETPMLIAKPETQVGTWSALQYCITKARLVHGASD